jgi:hypothetical protein
MMTPNAKIINNLEESYFLNEKSIWDKYYFEQKQKDIVSYIYNQSLSKQYGLNKINDEFHLRMFKVYKFLLKSKIDYIIQPVVLIADKQNNITMEQDHQYDNLYPNNRIGEHHKILSYVTYSHVLPDGRIIEYFHEPLANTISFKDVYQEVMQLR